MPDRLVGVLAAEAFFTKSSHSPNHYAFRPLFLLGDLLRFEITPGRLC